MLHDDLLSLVVSAQLAQLVDFPFHIVSLVVAVLRRQNLLVNLLQQVIGREQTALALVDDSVDFAGQIIRIDGVLSQLLQPLYHVKFLVASYVVVILQHVADYVQCLLVTEITVLVIVVLIDAVAFKLVGQRFEQ